MAETVRDYQEVRNFKAGERAFFTDEDNKASIRNAVLGRTVLKNLFGNNDPVGEIIRIGRITFHVTGIMEPKGVDLNGVDKGDQIFIPLQTALRRVFITYISTIYVQPFSSGEMGRAVSQIAEFLRDRHRFNKLNKPDDFTIQTRVELLETHRETTDTFTTLIASITSISLLVGGIGILAIMLIAIRERVNEISLRVAARASRKDILLQFIIEASILGICGGIIGIIVGIVISLVPGIVTSWNLIISIPSIVYSFIFSLTIGLFFGVYPARKASLLNPIETLKNE